MEKEILFRINEDGDISSESKTDVNAKDILMIVSRCYLILNDAGIELEDIAEYSSAILNQMLKNNKEIEENKVEGEA